MNIPVAIVEDNAALRTSLAQLIDSAPNLVCVGAFADAEDLLDRLQTCKPDVVLMDIGLPGMSGVEALPRLKEARPTAEVLMLTVYDDDKRIFEAVCAGASGYLLKKTPPEQILQAILDIRRGGAPMTPKIARRVIEMFRGASPTSQFSRQLSQREEEVLNALVEGLSYKMIADQLYISIDTVRSHIKHIYEKLHVNSKAQAIALALRSGKSRSQ
jgi:DNA-binding NarL/FixJ family response regulator